MAFDNFMRQEKFNFEMGLSGFENMANFSYASSDFHKKASSPQVVNCFGALKTILKDTIKDGYNEGFVYSVFNEALYS